MKIQILWDNLIIAEALTSVDETLPQRCPECGRLETRTWQVRQNDQAVEHLSNLHASTRLEVRMQPE